jgi:hypothetical protein
MKQRDLILLVVAVGLLGGAAAVYSWRTEEAAQASSDFPHGMHYICSQCEHAFTVTYDEWVEYRDQNLEAEGDYPCLKCSSTATNRATRCPACKVYLSRWTLQPGDPNCPECGKSLDPFEYE